MTPEGGTVTDNDTSASQPGPQPTPLDDPPEMPRRSLRKEGMAALGRHKRTARSLGLVLVALVIGAAYVAGGPPSAAGNTSPQLVPVAADRLQAAATAGPAAGDMTTKTYSGTGVSAGAPQVDPANGATTDQTKPAGNGTDQSATVAAAEQTQIIKTGQISLEVPNIDAAIGRSETAIAGLGGSVGSSNQYGTGDQVTASITFKVPAARWDEAVAALKAVGSKVLSMQTGTTDVTSSVIDLDARINNLQTTEAALQSIMARATVIADVIAVEKELSNVQGQIEELTAERDHLKAQAAMSTLTVTLQLPAKTVTTQATEDWTLSKQIDQAGAALVRIGQGLATMAVWLLIVILPVGLALLLVLGFLFIARRVLRRGRRGAAVAQS
jgi:Domain of unknown function (DUF4349)